MDDKLAQGRSHNPNHTSIPGLPDDAKQAVNAAFDVISTWRAETAKHSEKAIEAMTQAARSLGWPEQVVDATRAQVQTIMKMQTEAMDRVMDAWEAQINSPKGMAGFPSEMMSKLQSGSGFGPQAGGLNADALGNLMMNPVQFWMQFGQQWQKNWTDAMNAWVKGGAFDDLRRR
jgi:hypothetical protein